MPLDDVSNHAHRLPNTEKPTVKRRRLNSGLVGVGSSKIYQSTENRKMIFTSHSLDGPLNLRQRSDNFRGKIQKPITLQDAPFGKVERGEFGLNSFPRGKFNTNGVDSACLQNLRSQYKNAKAKYLHMESAIIRAKASHEKNIQFIKESRLKRKKELSANFNERLKFIEEEYFQKAQTAVERQNNEYKERISALNTEISNLKRDIISVTTFDFSKRLAELEGQYNEKINKFVKEMNVKASNIGKEKDSYQDKKENVKSLIKMHIMHKCNVLTPLLEKSQNELQKVKQANNLLEKKIAEVADNIEVLKANLERKRQEAITYNEESEDLRNEKLKYDTMIKDEDAIRRLVHNEFQDLKGNIRVFCRLKPVNKESAFHTCIDSVLHTTNGKECLMVTEPIRQKSKCYSPDKQNTHKFYFDSIFDSKASNSDIFVEVSQLIQSALDGYNVCIFTYGQTGSGKTFTMSNANDGIIPKSLNQIFSSIESSSGVGWDFQAYGQFFEIYGDGVRDLLGPNSLQNANDVNHVSKIKLSGIDQVNMLILKANNKRSTALTTCNSVSSRSHSIFRIVIHGTNENGKKISGILNLVDLAGSERIAQSRVTGMRLKETQAINKSLSALGDVITALHNKSSHVPYRNSKLTYLLKDSLSGSSKTLMLVNISCFKDHFSESLNSLRFASKVNSTNFKA